MGTSVARFVPKVALTHDDDDSNSHMSDIPLQLPACKFFLEQFFIGDVLRGWERPSAKCSQSPTDTKSDRSALRAITVSCYISSKCKKLFNWLHNEREKLCIISAKRLDVLSSIDKDNFLLPLINMKRLRGNTLSTLWQETVKHTIRVSRCEFDKEKCW